MRMLLSVDIPDEPFSALVRQGTAGETIGKQSWMTAGPRPSISLSNTAGEAQCSSLMSPMPRRFSDGGAVFLKFNANCRFRIVMGPEDLKKAGLEQLGKKWS